ncbi:MAG TPA: hypothetical protein VE153_41560 [Myxococcus sp.]|nr:hypothetical protein [Myxococcus sp.]
MKGCLPRGAARWLAAGVLVLPALAPFTASASMASEPPSPTGQPAAEAPAPGTPTEGGQPGANPTTAEASADPFVARPCTPDARFSSLWPKSEDVTFHPTTLRERKALGKLIPALLEAAPKRRTPPKGLEKVAASAGFELEVWEGEKGVRDTFWVLREQPGKLRGAGAYVIRTGPATDDVVQVPHPWFDRGTEDIGVGLFACAPMDRQPRLFMTATVHRYQGNPGETPEDPEHPADVAHNPEHLFQEVTNLAARALPAPRVVQLHGFGTAKAGRDKELVAVVSSGTRRPTGWARKVSAGLVKLLGEGVRLYPEGAQVLGGTQNAQGRLLQAYDCAHFLHLELSVHARKALTSGEWLARVGHVLFAPLED